MVTSGQSTVPESSPQQDEIRNLLSFLPGLYPGSDSWLQSRLQLADQGRAFAREARDAQGKLVGILLGIPKENSRFKISTLYVADGNRGRGIGGELLDAAISEAQRLKVADIYITGASIVRDQLFPLLASRGFSLISTAKDRYGVGRDEDIYSLQL